jgi:inosose dehydratase
MTVRLGCGQITWRGVPEESVLADIAQAGYEGAPLSIRDRSATAIKEAYARHGLVAAPGYFGGDFWVEGQRETHVAAARRYAQVSAELGLTELYVAAGGFQQTTRAGRTRRQAAGHATPEDALSEEEFDRFADCLDAIGRATLAEGVRSCYHNHVGTFVETAEEIERLLDRVDPDVLHLGPDTGHLAWAGIDVVDFTRRHAARIKTMHLKDVVAEVRDEGRAAGWDYGTYESHALWTEIGSGSVDFATVFSLLDGAGFSGWLVVETDVTQRETPLESAVLSRQALRGLGI